MQVGYHASSPERMWQKEQFCPQQEKHLSIYKTKHDKILSARHPRRTKFCLQLCVHAWVYKNNFWKNFDKILSLFEWISFYVIKFWNKMSWKPGPEVLK